MSEFKFKLVCAKCGGTNIETKMWVDPNDCKALDLTSDGDPEDNWCRDCEEHTDFNYDLIDE